MQDSDSEPGPVKKSAPVKKSVVLSTPPVAVVMSHREIQFVFFPFRSANNHLVNALQGTCLVVQ